ncbi:hypothetical protein LIER_30166 [Lithospermum erythrorhizon]|uniref:Protein NUCLEAR FUSION DEFECTIVE 6, chloroplastic/mitochondrial-like n=1 Tax=Lithospermum erythrorhizon TaxID=34254 RepID=A0AAV3RLS5_LITER
MASIAAARAGLRSASTRLSAASKSKMGSTSFRISPQKPLSARIFRSPVEMSVVVQSMLPYHTATASALLNSMLSVAPRGYGWTIEGLYKDR